MKAYRPKPRPTGDKSMARAPRSHAAIISALAVLLLAGCAPQAPKPPLRPMPASAPRPADDLLWEVAERIHNEYLTPIEVNVLLTRAMDGAALTPGLNDASRAMLRTAGRRIGETQAPPQNSSKQLDTALGGTNLPATVMQEAALAAMVNGLDPRTSYLSAAPFRAMQVTTRSPIGSVGLQVNRSGADVIVKRPLPGSPAGRAGILPRDLLLSIDDRNLHGMAFESVIPLLQGPVGSTAILRLRRPGVTTPLMISMNRAVVTTEPVTSSLLGPIAYIALDDFDERMVPQLHARLSAMRTASGHLAGIVLDLRGSQGGLVDTVAEVARTFLPKGATILTQVPRNKEESQTFSTTQNGPAIDLPMVVLVDAQTASGAEIVAGALQDNRRAVIMGTRTLGAGTVQTVMPLPAGHGALRLTTAQVVLPSGRPLGPSGITPDIPLPKGPPVACTPGPCDLPARLRAIRADPALVGYGPDAFAIEVAKTMQP